MASKLRFGCWFRFHKWIVFLSALLVYSHIIRFYYALGALFPTIMDKFGVTRAKASLIQSVYAASIYGGGVLHGTLTDKLGPKWTGLLGAILTSIGLFLSFWSTSLAFLVVCLGAVKVEQECVWCQHLWPLDNILLENCVVVLSVLVSGSGVGGMELIYLIRYLSDTYGLNGTLLILTGLDMNCAVLALLWKPPVDQQSAGEINDKGINNTDMQRESDGINSNIIINTKNEHDSTNDLDNLRHRSASRHKDVLKKYNQFEEGRIEYGVTRGQSSCHFTETDREVAGEIKIYDKVTHHSYMNKTFVSEIDDVFNDDSAHENTLSENTTANPNSDNSGTVDILFKSRSEESTYARHLFNENLKPDTNNLENSNQLSTSQHNEECKDLARSNADSRNASLTFKQKMKNMLSVKSFVFILIGLALSLNVSLMFIVFIVDIIMDRGYTEDQGTVGLTILTIANVLGRLTHGTLLPCPFDTTFILPIIATGLSSLAMVVLALADNLAVYYVLCCVLGNGLGVQVSVIVVTTSQILEVQYLPYAIGTLITVTGLPNLAVGPIADLPVRHQVAICDICSLLLSRYLCHHQHEKQGAIRDVMGTYTMSVLIAAGVNTLGMVMFILAQRFHTKKNYI